jgi:hypothetical protein
MKRTAFLWLAVAAVAGVVASTVPVSGHADDAAASIEGIKAPPPGYRDWRVISVAREEANFNSFAIVLGNDIAIKAYRDGKLPFPDGTIIAALHYRFVPSEENNKAFGQAQSFVAGPPTNVQFMVKDSTKWAATAGWGFAHFNADGKPVDEPFMKACFPCHEKAKNDLIFTHYAP